MSSSPSIRHLNPIPGNNLSIGKNAGLILVALAVPLISYGFLVKSHDPSELKFHHFLVFFFLFRAAPAAYGGSQARGVESAVAAGLWHSHSNLGSEPRMRPMPQRMEMPDP